MLAFSAMMMLAACSSYVSKGKVDAGIELPLLPAELARRCGGTSIKKGDDARDVIARLQLALATCTRRHRNTVQFYNDTRAGFGKKAVK